MVFDGYQKALTEARRIVAVIHHIFRRSRFISFIQINTAIRVVLFREKKFHIEGSKTCLIQIVCRARNVPFRNISIHLLNCILSTKTERIREHPKT